MGYLETLKRLSGQKAAPVAKWLRLLATEHSLWLDHLTSVDLSLARVTCRTSKVLLADGQVDLLGDL